MQKLDESLEAHQSNRILEAASEWEDHIQSKMDEVMQEMDIKTQETIRRHMQAYEDTLEEISRQQERRTKTP